MTNEKTAELHPDLEPPEGTVVATGDEENPVSGVKQEDALKAIYAKSRKDRTLVTREDEQENPDAEMIAKMVAESADEGEFEHAHTDAIDLTTRPDRVSSEDEPTDDPEFVEQVNHESEPEYRSAEPVVAEKQEKDLGYEVNDGKVTAVVEGVEYQVPAVDVESAGGLVQYQMNRAANIRFQKAATFGKALQKEREELAKQPQPDSAAEGGLPVQDDLSEKAELVRNYREKVLDAALDGTEADVDAALADLIEKSHGTDLAENSTNETEPLASDQVVEEYAVGYKLDRAKANNMLATDYSDVMDNEDLRKIAHSKYLELDSDPRSAGRTAVEMAREAGDFVRRISNAPKTKSTQDTELAARRTIKRVLPQASEARTRHKPLETKKPRSNSAYIRDIRRKQGNA